jgi:uncharacterized membrane protein
MLTFTTPAALLLLVCLAFVAWLGWPRTAYRRARDRVSLFVRALIVLALVLALAGLQRVEGANALAVVFVLDRSDSIPAEAREAQIAYVRDALTAMPPDDRAGVVVFGADALIEQPLAALRTLAAVRSTPISGGSDIAEALNLAMALFPPERARRIVLLSDGLQTVGSAAAAAEHAAATGVEISIVPFVGGDARDMQVTAVSAPASVNAGQTFDLSVTVSAQAPETATLDLFAEGALISSQPVALDAGETTFTYTLTAGEGGFSDFQARINPQTAADAPGAAEPPPAPVGDRFYQNNQLAAFTRVVGPPRVLVMAVQPEESRFLAAALREQGFTVDERTPSAVPLDIAALERYDAVIVADVPATALSPRRQALLRTYVRDLGGGLVFVGGPNSYAPGGYFDQPLADALPVEMQIRDQQRLPQFTIAYVIDRSGSMLDIGPSGVENIELAKEAIIRSLELLQPTDRAGVVSFDTEGIWVAELQPVLDRFALQNRVGSLRAGGGTDILAGYRLAATALAEDPAQRKHIIILTDGGADPTGLVELAQTLNTGDETGVTTSVVAIGGGPDFLAEMARVGGGNYYDVQRADDIPTIFTQETVLAQRSYIIEGAFTPGIGAPSPILTGLTGTPPLLGYVATSARDTAQVVLNSAEPYRDPVLAQWQYGLGRAVAFTSDATARWGAAWVAWPDFARFWGQAVRYTIIEGADDQVETRIVMQGEQALITVDARVPDDPATPDDEAGGFLNGLALSASVVAPDESARRVVLRQTAPGLYQGAFTPPLEGAYFIHVSESAGGETADGPGVSQTSGWVMAYSPEYALRAGASAADGVALLALLAETTGGRDLSAEPAAAFARTLQADGAAQPLAPWLLLAALVLLPFDVAVRRLIITATDIARARAWMRARFGAGPAADDEARLASLRGAKARARDQVTAQAARTTGEVTPVRPSAAAPASSAPAQTAPTAPAPGPAAPGPAARGRQDSGSLASALLKKRRGGEPAD